jgi:hypothetical protein
MHATDHSSVELNIMGRRRTIKHVHAPSQETICVLKDGHHETQRFA